MRRAKKTKNRAREKRDDYGAIGMARRDEDIGIDEIIGDIDEIIGDDGDDDLLDDIVAGDDDDDDDDDDEDDEDEDIGRGTSAYRRRRNKSRRVAKMYRSRMKRMRKSQSRLARLAHRMKLEREINPDAALVVPQKRTKIRILILPIPRTTVPAGATATIDIQPQDLFRAQRMLIPSDIAFDFEIQDIKVGQKPQFVQSGSIPAAVFSEVSVGSAVSFDSADIGNILNIVIKNNSLGPLDFAGTFLGTTAK